MMLDHLVVALEEEGPALRAEAQRSLQVLVDVHVGQVAKVLLAGTQSLIHKLWGHHHWLFLLFLGLLVSWGLFLVRLDRIRLPLGIYHQLENVAGSCQPEVLCSQGRGYLLSP